MRPHFLNLMLWHQRDAVGIGTMAQNGPWPHQHRNSPAKPAMLTIIFQARAFEVQQLLISQSFLAKSTNVMLQTIIRQLTLTMPFTTHWGVSVFMKTRGAKSEMQQLGILVFAELVR